MGCLVRDGQDEALQTKLNTSVPHSARVWNYWLMGKDNFAADRALGDQIKAVFPDIEGIALESRRFITRAVTYLVREAGVTQFLDIGTGLPTADNTHEVAQRLDPEARVVYVDNDPLVLVHARALLTSTPDGVTEYIEADVRDPDTILDAARGVLDFGQPVALMLIGILGNVEKYAPGGQVAIATTAAPPLTTITVADSGPGIAAADAERIFQPFVRLGGAAHEGVPGTGIGLPIARDLARLHGGDLRLLTPGTGAGAGLPGARFQLTLRTEPVT